MIKYISVLLILLFPIFSFAQDSEYNISSFLNIGEKAQNIHHIGDAWLNFLSKADKDYNYNVVMATFSPNSTLDWHKHSTGQVLIVVEGEGYYQERGKDVIVLKKCDVIKSAKGVEHWHSSTPSNKVSYIAIYENEPTIWTEKLTKKYYDNID